MIARLPAPGRDLPPPLVLVADEDPQVVEAVVSALQVHHFRITVAEDGDDVLRRTHDESPDLIIASVRLKGRGGLELCGTLRREVDWGDMAIVLLSPASDAEARVEGLAHGADDFITKPFSPRELVARAQRLVTRVRESARHRARNAELERDAVRLEETARRARDEAERERGLRTLSGSFFSALLRTLDLDELDARLLRETCLQTGAHSAALLAAPAAPGAREMGGWRVAAVRGELPERWAALALDPCGPCMEWLAALGRPALLSELERLPELAREVGELAAHGVAMLAAVPGARGAEAVVVCEERADGTPFGAAERDRFGALCAAAAPARSVARRFRAHQDRALELLSAPASADPRRREAARETSDRLLALGTELGLSPADRALLVRALGLGPWVWSDTGRTALAELAAEAGSHPLRQLRELVARAHACAAAEPGAGEDALPVLAALGLRYQVLRLSGRSAFESWRTAVIWLGMLGNPTLRDAFPEVFSAARPASGAAAPDRAPAGPGPTSRWSPA